MVHGVDAQYVVLMHSMCILMQRQTNITCAEQLLIFYYFKTFNDRRIYTVHEIDKYPNYIEDDQDIRDIMNKGLLFSSHY